MSTFISTGNLPNNFPSLCKFLSNNLDSLDKPILIQSLAKDVSFFAKDNQISILPSLSKADYSFQLENASILIGHCGGGFLQDCLMAGKLAYFLPRRASFGEHIDDHQIELSQFIKEKNLGIILFPNEFVDVKPCEIIPRSKLKIEFYDELPYLGNFLAVSSVGGHLKWIQQSIKGIENSQKGNCIKLVVDEKRPFLEDEIILHSCKNLYGFPIAFLQMLFVFIKYKPNAIITHGAGIGFVGATVTRLFRKNVYACSDLCRIAHPGRWFRACLAIGSKCYAPEIATFLDSKRYNMIKCVKVLHNKI